MLTNGPGRLLKETRENKGLTLQQAAEATKITSRHIRALEEDNYSVFPGETYITGFLRSYADFLGLDAEHVIQLFRGAQMAEKEVPLVELTKPTMTPLDRYRDKIGVFLKAFAVLAVVGGLLVLGLNWPDSNNTHVSTDPIGTNDTGSTVSNETSLPVGIETSHIRLKDGFTTAVVRVGEGINFSLKNTEIYLVLDELNYKKTADENSTAKMILYPGQKTIQVTEGLPVWIEEAEIPRKFRLTLRGATPKNIKLQIDLGEATEEQIETAQKQQTETRIANPDNFIIVFDAITTGNNFVEFYVDGQPRKKGLLAKGSRLHFEANDSIQMKIGDAGSIDIRINDKKYTFGPKGKQVSKIIRKIKDPVESTRFKIIIKDS